MLVDCPAKQGDLHIIWWSYCNEQNSNLSVFNSAVITKAGSRLSSVFKTIEKREENHLTELKYFKEELARSPDNAVTVMVYYRI